MATVDSLDIEISSSVQDANKAIDSLVDKLEKVQETILSIGKNNGLSNIANSLSSEIENVSPAFKNASSSADKMAKNISNSLDILMDKYKDLGKNFQVFGSEKKIDSDILKYSNALEKASLKKEELETTGKIDGKTYEDAIKDVQKYTNILENLRVKKEELSAQKVDIIQGGAGFTDLSKMNEQQLDDWLNALPGIQKQSREIESTVQSVFDGIREEIREFSGEWNGIKLPDLFETDLSKMTPDQLDEWFNALPSIQNKANEMEQTVSESFDNVSEKIVEFSGAWNGIELPRFDDLEDAGEKARDFASALNSLKGITPKVDESNLERLQSKLKTVEQHTEQLRYELEKGFRLGEIDYGDKNFDKLTLKIQESENQAERLRERISEISGRNSISGLTASFSDLGSAIKSGALRLGNLLKSLLGVDKASRRFNGSLSGGFKTLLKYGLGIRSVYILVNKLRSAIKEGMKNLVQYSDEVNASVSLLRNSLNQTKNALAAGFSPALNALAPVLNNLIQLFIRAVNAVNQLTSALLGKSTWIKAKTLTDDYAKSLNKAGKAAKGAVREIDELKIITTQDNGGAGDETPAEDMFETVEVETDISDFAERLKEMWKNADFTDLGEIIGNKIKNALDGINWNSVYEGARNFGKSLATFLNGLISPGLFGSVGKTIASGLNTAIYAALSFGENFDFKDFGLSIASGINNFFATFDFKSLAKTINVWAQGIFSTVSTAMANIDWRKIGQSIGDFLAGIDWGAILRSVAKLIWQALSAVFEMFAGVWDNAPIEAAVIGLAGIYKSLKLITASKFVSGIKKLVSNFKNLYKETGSVGGVIGEVSNSLSGFQKAAIGITAVVGEYAVLKDAFYDISKGTDNLLASLGQIVVGAGAASAALYVAFGPAGLVMAGLTALVAGFMGVKSAMEDLVDENIGINIRDAFVNPGGTPIESIAEKFKNVVNEVGDSFSRINEKSASMETTKDNIMDVWTEIEQIRLQMDAGVISVEEGTEKLSQLFSELATLTQEKFGAINSSLVAAFGENGAFRKYADAVGVDVSNELLTAIGITGEMQDRATELITLLSNPNISAQEYTDYQSELNNLLGITDDLSIAMDEFSSQLSNLDYSLVFDVDTGELDTDALNDFLNSIQTSITTADGQIEQAANSILESLQQAFEYAGTEEEKNAILTLMDITTQGMESAKEDIRQQAADITDLMQQDFIGKLSEIIEDAEEDWENLSYWDKFLMNLTGGPNSKEDYIHDAVKKQQENINTLSSATKEMFETLGTDGAGWASDAAAKIYESLFNIDYTHSGLDVEMRENYKSIIDSALSEMPGYTEQYGQDTVTGFNEGVLKNTESSKETSKAWMEDVRNAIHDSAMNFGSPSETTKEFGKDTVDGYNLGITDNEQSTLDIIASYMNSAKTKFLEFIGVFVDAGNQMMNGLLNGMSEKEPNLYEKTGNIADNIANTVKNALDIHSPSRVMFRVGDFTMEGMEEGMESRYSSILSSLKEFSTDLRLAPMPTVSGMYGDYQKYAYNNAFSSAYEPVVSSNGAYIQNNTETNNLLRQQVDILKGILAKEFGITESQIGQAAANYSRDYMNRTGRPAYSF